MKLTAIFESWLVPDGNYPPLHRGQLVNLSFQIRPQTLEQVGQESVEIFENLQDAEYRFAARVLRVYGEERIVAAEALGFRFFLENLGIDKAPEGATLFGNGGLYVDYYRWVENVERRHNPPDLFHTLRVTRIRQVQLPQEYLSRNDLGGSAWPTYVGPDKYRTSAIKDLHTMEGQPFSTEFYLVDFDNKGLRGASVPRTFLSTQA